MSADRNRTYRYDRGPTRADHLPGKASATGAIRSALVAELERAGYQFEITARYQWRVIAPSGKFVAGKMTFRDAVIAASDHYNARAKRRAAGVNNEETNDDVQTQI